MAIARWHLRRTLVVPKRPMNRLARRGASLPGEVLLRPTIASLCGLFALGLLWILRDFISPVFQYAGFGWSVPDSTVSLLLTALMVVAPAWFLPLSGEKPGNIMLWLLYLVAYIPIQIMPMFAASRTVHDVWPLTLSVLIGFLIIVAIASLPSIALPQVNIPSAIYWTAIVAFSFLSLSLAMLSYGIPNQIPSLTDVYDVRSDFHQERAGVSTVVILIVNWQQKVVNPLLFAYGLLSRRWTLIALSTIGQILLFGITGQKAVVFSTLMVVAVLIAMWGRGRRLALMVVGGAMLLVVATAILDTMSGSITFTSMFVRRLMLVPGLLTTYYYDFFSQSPNVLLSNSVLSGFIEYPYDVSIPRLIGIRYFGRPELNANANIWADAYAQAGVLGIVIASFLAGSVIWLLNAVSVRKDILISSALAGTAAWTLTDTGLLIALNTHGLLFAIVLLYLLPRRKSVPAVDAPSSRHQKQKAMLRAPSSAGGR